MDRLSTWAPRGLSILRIVAGLLFAEHGAMKLLQFPGPQDGVSYPLPPLMLVAGVLELVGGSLLTVGFLTRPVAFLLSGEMAIAYWTAHFPANPWPGLNNGEAAILYCFVFLYLAFAGPGPWSIDAKFGDVAGRMPNDGSG